MKKMFFILLIVFCALQGCVMQGQSNIDANYQNANIMLPDLISYVERDTSVSVEDREIRINAIREWLNLINKTYAESRENE